MISVVNHRVKSVLVLRWCLVHLKNVKITNHSLGFNARWDVIEIMEEIFDFFRLDLSKRLLEGCFILASVEEISPEDMRYPRTNQYRESVPQKLILTGNKKKYYLHDETYVWSPGTISLHLP